VLGCAGNVVFCQLRPWEFDQTAERFNQRRTFARTSVAVTRLLANLGVSGSTPLLQRFGSPEATAGAKAANAGSGTPGRWTEGLYLITPTEWDDPYRFFRW
jgi:hypothetical protein